MITYLAFLQKYSVDLRKLFLYNMLVTLETRQGSSLQFIHYS